MKLKKYSKQYKNCPFYNTLQFKLRRYIDLKHHNIKEVLSLSNLDKKKFEKFKKRGVFMYNKEAGKINGDFQRERHSKNSTNLVMCINCCGFYSRKYLYKHLKMCDSKYNSQKYVSPVKFIPACFHKETPSSKFLEDVVSKFHLDSIGKLCTYFKTR